MSDHPSKHPCPPDWAPALECSKSSLLNLKPIENCSVLYDNLSVLKYYKMLERSNFWEELKFSVSKYRGWSDAIATSVKDKPCSMEIRFTNALMFAQLIS